MENQPIATRWNVFDTLEQTNRNLSVVVGLFLGLNDEGKPLVDYPGNPSGQALLARTTRTVGSSERGQDAVLVFEDGDPAKPIIMGLLQSSMSEAESEEPAAEVETLEFRAEKEIVLRCGDASITLTRAGKVMIRGKYLLSSSSGVNMLKGGVIHLN
jgi:hypothetical protein